MFLRNEARTYHTYRTYPVGLDIFLPAYQLLEMPLGRSIHLDRDSVARQRESRNARLLSINDFNPRCWPQAVRNNCNRLRKASRAREMGEGRSYPALAMLHLGDFRPRLGAAVSSVAMGCQRLTETTRATLPRGQRVRLCASERMGLNLNGVQFWRLFRGTHRRLTPGCVRYRTKRRRRYLYPERGMALNCH